MGKILLVQENDGLWSLPGGWVNVNASVKESAVREEAGLDAAAELVIAVQDREKHDRPVYARKICKVFILCSVIGGHFTENIETVGSGWLSLDELPPLSEEKIPESRSRCVLTRSTRNTGSQV